MKFTGKWVEIENIILSEVTQSQKYTHGIHSLISSIAQNTQETSHQTNDAPGEGRTKWDASVISRSRIKILMRGKDEAETKGTAIQSLPNLGIHPI